MKTNAVPFSETSKGASLVLSSGDTILQTALNVDAHRMARSQYGLAGATLRGAVEFYVYSPSGAKPSLAPSGGVPPLCFGFALGNAVFNEYVGEQPHAVSYCPGDGGVRVGGSVVATLAPGGYDTFYGGIIDYVRKLITFTKGPDILGTFDFSGLVTGTPAVFYAATVSGNPGDMAIWANAGQTPFRYPNSVGGFYHQQAGITSLFLATEPYISAPNDARPNQPYEPQIDRQNTKIAMPSCVQFWMWGRSMPRDLQSNAGFQIEILDPHGQADSLMRQGIRDQVTSIATVKQGAAQSTQIPVYTCIIDRCEQPTDQRKMLYCLSKLSLLDIQMIRALFAPNVDASFAGKPYPYSGGICRTYVGAQYDSGVTPIPIQLADEPISAFGKVRRQGVEMGYGIDFTVGADGESVTLPQAPSGKVTFETTTFGGSFDATATDLLGGDGNFGSIANDGGGGGVNQPHDWTGNGGYFSNDPLNTDWQVRGTSPNKYVEQFQNASAVYWLKHQTLTIAPGESVAFEVELKLAPYYGPAVDALGNPIEVFPAKLFFGGQSDSTLQFYFWGGVTSIPDPQNYAGGPTPAPVQYRGTFTNTGTQALPLVFGLLCNEMIQGTGGINSYLQVNHIKLTQLPALTQNVVLDGPGLDLMSQDILIGHGPLELTDYNQASAQAIDAVTGYKCGLHISSNTTPACKDAWKKVYDSFCACPYVDETGNISLMRLVDPEAAGTVVDGTLTANDVIGFLEPWPDLAENLSTRMSGCPNYDKYTESDFTNVSQGDVPQVVRKVLEQDYQWTVQANAIIDEAYAYARAALPFPSQLDRQSDGQAEITYVNNLYAVKRNFYVGTYPVIPGRTFKLGRVWNHSYPTSTLVNGRNLLIVGIVPSPTEGTVKIIWWGQ